MATLLRPGDSIGPYVIEAVLGQGGMAVVYRALHTGLQRREALKMPLAEMLHNPDFVRRFTREARISAGLQHPNIVAIYAVSEEGKGDPYISMEFIDGTDLATFIQQRGRLSLPETLSLVAQIASALDYAHEKGVIHRDIKPANILLSKREGKLFASVADFGIARAQENAGTKLTQNGMIIGTPEYMSPEQGGNGEVIGAQSDQYSLAVMAYELLSGSPPFSAQNGQSTMSVIMAHVRDVPRPLSVVAPSVPKSVSDAVQRALSKKPGERYRTCADLVHAMGSSKAEGGDRKGLLIGGVAALSLLGAGLIYAGFSGGSQPNPLPPKPAAQELKPAGDSAVDRSVPADSKGEQAPAQPVETSAPKAADQPKAVEQTKSAEATKTAEADQTAPPAIQKVVQAHPLPGFTWTFPATAHELATNIGGTQRFLVTQQNLPAKTASVFVAVDSEKSAEDPLNYPLKIDAKFRKKSDYQPIVGPIRTQAYGGPAVEWEYVRAGIHRHIIYVNHGPWGCAVLESAPEILWNSEREFLDGVANSVQFN